MRLGDAGATYEVESIPTGSLGLDIALGVGGIPRGRVIEIFGPESSGKTTLDTLVIIASAQKNGGIVAFVDAEHALDPVYAEKLGVVFNEDLPGLLLDTGEQALETTRHVLVRSGAVDVVVVDSVAALTPKAEIEGEMGDQHMGLVCAAHVAGAAQAHGQHQALEHHRTFHQPDPVRKSGVMFGNPETTTGGNALKFYSSVRMDIRRIGAIKNGEEVVGSMTRGQGGVKNKVAPVSRDRVRDRVRQWASPRKARSSSSVCCTIRSRNPAPGTASQGRGERIGQGKDNVRTFLAAASGNFQRDIEAQIRAKLIPEKATMSRGADAKEAVSVWQSPGVSSIRSTPERCTRRGARCPLAPRSRLRRAAREVARGKG